MRISPSTTGIRSSVSPPRWSISAKKPNRPGGGRPQAPVAEAIGQHQTQESDGAVDHASPQERFCLPRARFEGGGPAQPVDDFLPVSIDTWFLRHPILESQTIPERKLYFSAYGVTTRGRALPLEHDHIRVRL